MIRLKVEVFETSNLTHDLQPSAFSLKLGLGFFRLTWV